MSIEERLLKQKSQDDNVRNVYHLGNSSKKLVTPIGFEPTTPGLGNLCSIP